MSATLDKSLPVPLYHQLKTVLLERIRTGEWKPDHRLPTEDQLERQFQVSKAVVRQALQELSQAGYVRREQGRGTFVSSQKVLFGPHDLTSFTQEMQERGLLVRSRLLQAARETVDAEIAEKLDLSPGSEVYVVKRLRLADDEPMGIQSVHIPARLAPALLETDFETASLYETLERRYGLVAEKALQTHFAISVKGREAELLHVPPGSPALAGERITYLRGGRPLEITHSVMRADRYQIRLSLSRAAGGHS